jgi:hypothetical protein
MTQSEAFLDAYSYVSGQINDGADLYDAVDTAVTRFSLSDDEAAELFDAFDSPDDYVDDETDDSYALASMGWGTDEDYRHEHDYVDGDYI